MREGKEEGTKKNVQRTNLNDFGLGEVFNLARCYLISKVSLCLEGAFIPFFFFIRNELLNWSSCYTVESCSSGCKSSSWFVT